MAALELPEFKATPAPPLPTATVYVWLFVKEKSFADLYPPAPPPPPAFEPPPPPPATTKYSITEEFAGGLDAQLAKVYVNELIEEL